LHLAAATAAAAGFDRAATEALLAKARGIADHTGQVNHMGTAFGHVNVAIHRRLEVCIGAERLTEAPLPPFGSKVLEAWRGRSFGRAAARATSNL